MFIYKAASLVVLAIPKSWHPSEKAGNLGTYKLMASVMVLHLSLNSHQRFTRADSRIIKFLPRPETHAKLLQSRPQENNAAMRPSHDNGARRSHHAPAALLACSHWARWSGRQAVNAPLSHLSLAVECACEPQIAHVWWMHPKPRNGLPSWRARAKTKRYCGQTRAERLGNEFA
jgi:hypothetical protein